MNPSTIILLSGKMGSGKSTVAKEILRHTSSGVLIETSDYLKRMHSAGYGRLAMQEKGDIIDQITQYKWVCNSVDEARPWMHDVVVVDAIRNPQQLIQIRTKFKSYRVIHIHCTLSDETRFSRLKDRGEDPIEKDTMTALNHPNELLQNDLDWMSDMTYDTDSVYDFQAIARPPCTDVIIGGQYGSEGKGHICSYIAPEYDVLVRSGGPNAGHMVRHPDGKTITCFFHIPSGAIHNERAPLLIGPAACINPTKLAKEMMDAEKYVPIRDRLIIDPKAIIITDDDMHAEDATFKGAIGSTAQGVGEAAIKRIRRDAETTMMASEHPVLSSYCADVSEYLHRCRERVLLEGTQGFGLSMIHGPWPYTTSRDTGVSGLISELGVPPATVRRTWMVARTHPIRVQSPTGGTSGPMENEITLEEIHERSGLDLNELRLRETTSTTKRKRRISEFDYDLFQRAIDYNAPTDICLTFADYFTKDNRGKETMEELDGTTQSLIEDIEKMAGVNVTLISTGFDHKYIIDRR